MKQKVKEKIKISNPARFWFGASMIIIEVLGLGIFGLTLLNWNWITEKVVLYSFIGIAVILYNFLAGMFILNGSKKEK